MMIKIKPYNMQELGQRENQEDSLFPAIGHSTPEDRLFILCDGMGGHEKGEVASSTVCDVMSKSIIANWQQDLPLPDDVLEDAIEDAYDALDAKDDGAVKKMGTTMTCVCFHAGGVTVAHIGDSRVYQLRSAKGDNPARIVFRTRDHSLVNDLIKIGEITEEEAKNHPQKNVITRAMQPCQPRRAKADIAHLTDIQDGDYFYMCSDGMLEQTSDENLLYIITKRGVKDTEKIEMLREVTSENKDNHTAHLIYIDKAKDEKAGGAINKSFIYLICCAVVLAAIAVAASFFLFSSSKDDNPEKSHEISESKNVEDSHQPSQQQAVRASDNAQVQPDAHDEESDNKDQKKDDKHDGRTIHGPSSSNANAQQPHHDNAHPAEIQQQAPAKKTSGLNSLKGDKKSDATDKIVN